MKLRALPIFAFLCALILTGCGASSDGGATDTDSYNKCLETEAAGRQTQHNGPSRVV